MRILLIAEQDVEFRMVGDLLKGIQGEVYQLSWCQADVSVLESTAVSRFQLVIWGSVSDPHIARDILTELGRQQANVPIVMLVDEAPAHVDLEAARRGESDILLRTGLDSQVLQRAIRRFARKSVDPQPAEFPTADPLTGLSNRQDFREQLARILDNAETPESVGLLLVDVDQFKKVNASYGQGAGDALIQLIAERIRSCLSAHQRVARIGGNEFAVVFQNVLGSVESECRVSIERIIQSMSRPFPVAQHAIRMNVSMGIAMNKETDVTVDAMLANADMAMRIAKREKGCNYQFYTSDMTDAAQTILKLEAEIRRGIRSEEFELHYQPRIDIKQNRIVGAECLVRWRHPTRGLLAPSHFIAVAEESGLIVPLGYWIIHHACKDLNELATKGHHDVQLAVNVSFKQFQDKNFVQTVANILSKQGITAGRLEFELTETTMMIEGQAVDQSLRKLSELGIDISLDDFGTGYSSFAHIQRLPISILKIDRSFVSSVTTNEDDATIVKAIINLAHSLSMQVIAEGAETAEQVEFLCLNKCDQVQGYFFSKPVIFDTLKKLLGQEDFVDRHIQSILAKSRALT
ncbi:MAG: EAL domain-containing protein [Gammaproteobacteria bacterium]|nr:EAL domain-containing protein [Gammaproteobacteria bacterium]